MFLISFTIECLTVVSSLLRGLILLQQVDISLVDIFLQGILITPPGNVYRLLAIKDSIFLISLKYLRLLIFVILFSITSLQLIRSILLRPYMKDF